MDGIYDDPNQVSTNHKTPAENTATETAATETVPKTTAPNTKKTKALLISQAVIVVALLAVAALAVAALVVAASGSRCSCGEVQELRALLTSLTQDVATVNSSVANLIASPIPYNPFAGCTRRIEATCDTRPQSNMVVSSRCETPPQPLNVADFYTTDVSCVYTEENEEQNPLFGTTRTRNNETVSCVCAAVNSTNPQDSTATCGIQITRCPSLQTIQLTT